MAGLGAARFEPRSGNIRYANAGNAVGLIVHADSWQALETSQPPLGEADELVLPTQSACIEPGDCLILVQPAGRPPLATRRHAEIAELVLDHSHESAQSLAERIARGEQGGPNPVTVLIARHLVDGEAAPG